MCEADKMTNLLICLDLIRSRYFGRYACSENYLILRGENPRSGENQFYTGTGTHLRPSPDEEFISSELLVRTESCFFFVKNCKIN